jgi:type II secretion system protein N
VSRFRRILLFFGGAVLGLAITALLVVNLYVQSQGTQARIQQELSQRLGTTVRVRSISVTPWSGLTLSGITISQNSNVSGSDFLEAKSFHLHVRLLSLFSQRLVIKEVSLLGPTVTWLQNANGKWRLPGASSVEQPVAQPEDSSSPSTLPAETAVPELPASPDNKETGTVKISPRAFAPEVKRINVSDGNFRFLDRTGNSVADFSGVLFHSSVRNSQAVRGTVSIAKISLRERFFLEQLQSPLHYEADELNLSQISARAGSGEVDGNFKVQPQSEDSPFTASVRFRDVQADQIVVEAGGPKGIIQGKIEGDFEATGKSADANALTGHGEIFLREGKLQQYSLLVALGQVLQIEELTQLQLQQADAKYHISPGLVTVDELILRSTNIRLSATGTITFEGKVRLASQLAINEKVRNQLFQPIRNNFRPLEEGGYFAVDFDVGGTLDRPRTNLMDKVVGKNLKDFVSGFLGGGKQDRPKRKKAKNANAAAPETGASPAEAEGTTPSPTPTPP